jgi:N-acetylglucosamine-6-phosphate deacetylase
MSRAYEYGKPGAKLRLLARRLFDGTTPKPRRDQLVQIENGVISQIADLARGDLDGSELEADILSPGFVDLQINGANDAQFNDSPDVETLHAMAAGARQGGTAHILPTFITDAGDRYVRAIVAVEQARAQDVPGILGLHLEGPFLSPDRPGIHPEDHIRPLNEHDFQRLEEANCGTILLTLAPEMTAPGAIVRLTRAGIYVFAGHSAATCAQMQNAVTEGVRGVTHLFNAMSQLGSRDPGVVGAALHSDQLFAGIIADGHHVDFGNVAMAHRLMGDRLCLVTDAMMTLAGNSQSFMIGDKKIYRTNNRLADAQGRLAGAHLAMDEALRNAVTRAGIDLGQALYMASCNPLRAIGQYEDLGQIKPGARASLTLLSDDLHAQGVVLDQRVYLK